MQDTLLEGIRKFNTLVLPPQRYIDTLMLGLSAVEEIYFITKNLIDGTISVSERVLYGDNYRQRRLGEYRGQRRLVVFVPGYMQTSLSLYRLERYLGIDIFDSFTYVWNDFPYSQNILLSAEQLREALRDMYGQTGVEEIYLVGHSQGGLIIRAMMQYNMGGGLPVRKCLFLSTPHGGTWAGIVAYPHFGLRKAASLFPRVRRVQGESGLQLVPNSDFLRELNQQPLPPDVRFTSVYYNIDPLILPPRNAVLRYPTAVNCLVNKIGHAQPLYCSRATEIAIRTLYGTEEDLNTVRTEMTDPKSAGRGR